MNSYSASCGRGHGRAPLGVGTCDPADGKIAEDLIQRADSLSSEGLVEPGLVVGYALRL